MRREDELSVRDMEKTLPSISLLHFSFIFVLVYGEVSYTCESYEVQYMYEEVLYTDESYALNCFYLTMIKSKLRSKPLSVY